MSQAPATPAPCPDDACSVASPDVEAPRCPESRSAAGKVDLVTVKALLTGDALHRLNGNAYRFCPDSGCDVVYFDNAADSVFRKPDLRVRVGLKEKEDPVPICYCFDITAADLRKEIATRGVTDVPARIAAEVRAGHCACEVRNPQGSCCLGNVSRAVDAIESEIRGEPEMSGADVNMERGVAESYDKLDELLASSTVSTLEKRGELMQKISPFLWFDNNAEEAMNFYISVFKNSKVLSVARYGEAGPGPKGTVMTAAFQLEGQEFIALNGGPQFKFTEAISFSVSCETQQEVDDFWAKLTAGGQESQCGWLKDKYGLSWQIVPTILPKLLKDKDPKKSQSVMKAMLRMKKIEIQELERAYDQA